MRIIHDLSKIRLRNIVVALGNFDGVHLGHRSILAAAVREAKKLKAKSIALTFDPHPQQFIQPERGLRLLTDLSEREKLIQATGIDYVFVIKFNGRLRKMSYPEFVKNFLIEKLDARVVLVGYDYAFGRDRSGDVSHLRELGARLGFAVKVKKPVSIRGGVVKSRTIRELISEGKFSKALSLMGHSYPLTGTVIRGAGRGAVLGFPTANLKIDEHKLVPAPGVYAGIATVKEKRHKCVVNIGNRPTFPGGGGAIEVHLPDFKGNIYGKKISVELMARFREERQFSDTRELVAQIKKDVQKARRTIKI